jgi:phosphohistidine phosphatase
MKTLHLIRHAKSSWDDSGLSDIDRPLAQRGINDCKVMASPLIKAGWNHLNIYCSQAQRALLTIAGLANALPGLKIEWKIDSELYTFSAGVLIDWLSQLNDEYNEITIVGHNPALTELINRLSGSRLDNLPTCGYAQLSAGMNSWSQTRKSSFKLKQLIKPKMFK